MDLFESAGTDDAGIPVDSHAPLAVRMRPRTLDELQGQAHLLTPGSPLRRRHSPPTRSLRVVASPVGLETEVNQCFDVL